MKQKKKILLITYYWTPSGSAGVYRWLKMCKHLYKDYEITVFHPENADYPIIDNSLKKEIPKEIKTISGKIYEPYRLAKFFNKKNSDYQKGQIDPKEKQSLFSKLSIWIRANYFIPDARMFWIKPSYNKLRKFLKNNPQDFIVSTGPPHSTHLIALKLKNKFPNIKWIADFRDPWTDIDYFDKLPFTPKAKAKQFALEKEVLQKANQVISVSETWANELSKISSKPVKVIYNGYDKISDNQKPKSATITYLGSLNDDRNPAILWKVLEKILKENTTLKENFKLKLIGTISPWVKSEINRYTNLSSCTDFINHIPQQQALEEISRSKVLLLLMNDTPNQKGIIPGKFFEYLASKRSILCLGNENSDLAKLIEKTASGVCIDRNNNEKIEKILNEFLIQKSFNELTINSNNFEKYSRKAAAKEFSELIEKI